MMMPIHIQQYNCILCTTSIDRTCIKGSCGAHFMKGSDLPIQSMEGTWQASSNCTSSNPWGVCMSLAPCTQATLLASAAAR